VTRLFPENEAVRDRCLAGVFGALALCLTLLAVPAGLRAQTNGAAALTDAQTATLTAGIA